MDIRGSGPNHTRELAAPTMPRVFPIPGSTGLHHAIVTLPKLENSLRSSVAALQLRSRGKRWSAIDLLLGEQSPGDTGRLVGERDGDEPCRLFCQERVDP